MRNVIIVGSTLVIILAIMVMSVNTVEIQSEVSVIKMLPADWNPYQRLYDEMLYPVVRISSANGVGSGVVIQCSRVKEFNSSKEILKPLNSLSFELYVLTAAHVVGNLSVVTVTIYTPLTPLNRGDFNASVVITDTNKDLALLRVLSVSAVNTAKLSPLDYNYYLFTPVYAIGCSLGSNPRPSSGIISAIHLSDLCVSAVNSWEMSAPILPGNSGGPVYDANTHEVIGIAVWVRRYQGQLITTMAGVVPIQTIYEFLDLATKTLSQSEASRQRD